MEAEFPRGLQAPEGTFGSQLKTRGIRQGSQMEGIDVALQAWKALMHLPGLRLLTTMKREQSGSSCPVLPRASSFWTDWELVLRGLAGEQDPASLLPHVRGIAESTPSWEMGRTIINPLGWGCCSDSVLAEWTTRWKEKAYDHKLQTDPEWLFGQ